MGLASSSCTIFTTYTDSLTSQVTGGKSEFKRQGQLFNEGELNSPRPGGSRPAEAPDASGTWEREAGEPGEPALTEDCTAAGERFGGDTGPLGDRSDAAVFAGVAGWG
jgi:hypothetical protein